MGNEPGVQEADGDDDKFDDRHDRLIGIAEGLSHWVGRSVGPGRIGEADHLHEEFLDDESNRVDDEDQPERADQVAENLLFRG